MFINFITSKHFAAGQIKGTKKSATKRRWFKKTTLQKLSIPSPERSLHPWKWTWNLKLTQWIWKIIWTKPPCLWVPAPKFQGFFPPEKKTSTKRVHETSPPHRGPRGRRIKGPFHPTKLKLTPPGAAEGNLWEEKINFLSHGKKKHLRIRIPYDIIYTGCIYMIGILNLFHGLWNNPRI